MSDNDFLGDSTISAKKGSFYTGGWITIGAFLGGPLVGYYLLGKNFAMLGRKDFAKQMYWSGVIITLLLFGILAFLPKHILNYIPHGIIAIIYTLFVRIHFLESQRFLVNKEISMGAKQYSGWRVIGLSILSLIISIVYYFIAAITAKLLNIS